MFFVRWFFFRVEMPALWSQHYDTKTMLHHNAAEEVHSAMPCHRTGYDRPNISTHASNPEVGIERDKKPGSWLALQWASCFRKAWFHTTTLFRTTTVRNFSVSAHEHRPSHGMQPRYELSMGFTCKSENTAAVMLKLVWNPPFSQLRNQA